MTRNYQNCRLTRKPLLQLKSFFRCGSCQNKKKQLCSKFCTFLIIGFAIISIVSAYVAWQNWRKRNRSVTSLEQLVGQIVKKIRSDEKKLNKDFEKKESQNELKKSLPLQEQTQLIENNEKIDHEKSHLATIKTKSEHPELGKRKSKNSLVEKRDISELEFKSGYRKHIHALIEKNVGVPNEKHNLDTIKSKREYPELKKKSKDSVVEKSDVSALEFKLGYKKDKNALIEKHVEIPQEKVHLEAVTNPELEKSSSKDSLVEKSNISELELKSGYMKDINALLEKHIGVPHEKIHIEKIPNKREHPELIKGRSKDSLVEKRNISELEFKARYKKDINALLEKHVGVPYGKIHLEKIASKREHPELKKRRSKDSLVEKSNTSELEFKSVYKKERNLLLDKHVAVPHEKVHAETMKRKGEHPELKKSKDSLVKKSDTSELDFKSRYKEDINALIENYAKVRHGKHNQITTLKPKKHPEIKKRKSKDSVVEKRDVSELDFKSGYKKEINTILEKHVGAPHEKRGVETKKREHLEFNERKSKDSLVEKHDATELEFKSSYKEDINALLENRVEVLHEKQGQETIKREYPELKKKRSKDSLVEKRNMSELEFKSSYKKDINALIEKHFGAPHRRKHLETIESKTEHQDKKNKRSKDSIVEKRDISELELQSGYKKDIHALIEKYFGTSHKKNRLNTTEKITKHPDLKERRSEGSLVKEPDISELEFKKGNKKDIHALLENYVGVSDEKLPLETLKYRREYPECKTKRSKDSLVEKRNKSELEFKSEYKKDINALLENYAEIPHEKFRLETIKSKRVNEYPDLKRGSKESWVEKRDLSELEFKSGFKRDINELIENHSRKVFDENNHLATKSNKEHPKLRSESIIKKRDTSELQFKSSYNKDINALLENQVSRDLSEFEFKSGFKKDINTLIENTKPKINRINGEKNRKAKIEVDKYHGKEIGLTKENHVLKTKIDTKNDLRDEELRAIFKEDIERYIVNDTGQKIKKRHDSDIGEEENVRKTKQHTKNNRLEAELKEALTEDIESYIRNDTEQMIEEVNKSETIKKKQSTQHNYTDEELTTTFKKDIENLIKNDTRQQIKKPYNMEMNESEKLKKLKEDTKVDRSDQKLKVNFREDIEKYIKKDTEPTTEKPHDSEININKEKIEKLKGDTKVNRSDQELKTTFKEDIEKYIDKDTESTIEKPHYSEININKEKIEKLKEETKVNRSDQELKATFKKDIESYIKNYTAPTFENPQDPDINKKEKLKRLNEGTKINLSDEKLKATFKEDILSFTKNDMGPTNEVERKLNFEEPLKPTRAPQINKNTKEYHEKMENENAKEIREDDRPTKSGKSVHFDETFEEKSSGNELKANLKKSEEKFTEKDAKKDLKKESSEEKLAKKNAKENFKNKKYKEKSVQKDAKQDLKLKMSKEKAKEKLAEKNAKEDMNKKRSEEKEKGKIAKKKLREDLNKEKSEEKAKQNLAKKESKDNLKKKRAEEKLAQKKSKEDLSKKKTEEKAKEKLAKKESKEDLKKEKLEEKLAKKDAKEELKKKKLEGKAKEKLAKKESKEDLKKEKLEEKLAKKKSKEDLKKEKSEEKAKEKLAKKESKEDLKREKLQEKLAKKESKEALKKEKLEDKLAKKKSKEDLKKEKSEEKAKEKLAKKESKEDLKREKLQEKIAQKESKEALKKEKLEEKLAKKKSKEDLKKEKSEEKAKEKLAKKESKEDLKKEKLEEKIAQKESKEALKKEKLEEKLAEKKSKEDLKKEKSKEKAKEKLAKKESKEDLKREKLQEKLAKKESKDALKKEKLEEKLAKKKSKEDLKKEKSEEKAKEKLAKKDAKEELKKIKSEEKLAKKKSEEDLKKKKSEEKLAKKESKEDLKREKLQEKLAKKESKDALKKEKLEEKLAKKKSKEDLKKEKSEEKAKEKLAKKDAKEELKKKKSEEKLAKKKSEEDLKKKKSEEKLAKKKSKEDLKKEKSEEKAKEKLAKKDAKEELKKEKLEEKLVKKDAKVNLKKKKSEEKLAKKKTKGKA